MEWMWRTNFFRIFLFCFLLSAKVLAQDSTSVTEKSSIGVTLNKFDEVRWKNLTNDLDYTENIRKKKEIDSSFSLPNFSINQTIVKIVLIALVTGALIFLLWKVFGDTKFLRNQKIKTGDFSLLNDAEENLENSDLESFLKDALENKQYKIAVRIYYLMTIKELMLRNFIVWKKDKTNFEYINEMRGKNGYEHFRSLTIAFEIVWYGDVEPEEKDFSILSPSFTTFINSIRNHGQK